MRYFVRVKLKQDFVRVEGETITVGVQATPEKGRANEETVAKIAQHFGVSKSSVRIVAGNTSRKKIVEIDK